MTKLLLCVVMACAAGCASVPTVSRLDNVSAGLHHAALYLNERGECIGEFQARSGEITRARYAKEFCTVVRAAIPPTPEVKP